MHYLKVLQELGWELKDNFNQALKKTQNIDNLKIRYPAIVDDILEAEHLGQIKYQLQDYFNNQIQVKEFAGFHGAIHAVLFMERMEATRSIARKEGLWDDKTIEDIKTLERYNSFGN